MRILVLIAVTLVLLAAAACDRSTSAPGGASVEVVTLYGRISRFLDKHWAARTSQPVLLTRSGEVVSDPEGKTVKLSGSEWDSVVSSVKATPEKTQPIRAAPAGGRKHDDGLGSVKRNAWSLRVTDDGKLEATFIKALDGESE